VIARRAVLLVSDRPAWVAEVTVGLENAGFAVAATRPSASVAEAFAKAPHDLAVIDTAGGGGAWGVAESLGAWRRILVVADGAAVRRGFALGAEDCVTEEAHLDELVARCEAVLRRSAAPPAADGPSSEAPAAVYVDRRLWVNLESHQVWVRGEPSKLTPREYRLLEYLITRRDVTLGHDELLEAVWRRKPSPDGQPEVLKQYIWRLRQKIEADPDRPRIVVTEPGAGYRFVSQS